MSRFLRVAALVALAVVLFFAFSFYRALAHNPTIGLPDGPLVIGLLAAGLVMLRYFTMRRLFPKA